MTVTSVVVAMILGAAIGSFVNVVLWRVPRHESIVRPPSHCPACDTSLRPAELVPVLSWVWLGGRCRTCRARISVRYPLVEAGFAALGGLVGWLLAR